MESIYKCIEPITVRMALGSIDAYEKMMQEKEHNIDSILEESILVATYDLFRALSLESNNKKYDGMLRSLLKYQIRRATRCTPYGLFAGVGVGNHSYDTEVKFSTANLEKRARVDMKWLYKYIGFILQDDCNMMNSYVKRNKLCYIYGNRVVNPYFSSGGRTEQNEMTVYSIRYTDVVRFVFEHCVNFIRCKDLIQLVSNQFNVIEQKARDLVLELINHEFLLNEIYPPMINTNPLLYVIDILKKMEDYRDANFLEFLNEEILKYNKLSIGSGVNQYLKIRELMKDKMEEKDFIQVDTKINFECCRISYDVVQELEDLVNRISVLAAGQSEQEYLTAYKEEFLEKYGYNTEVPIMEMLDYNMGIGLPANYRNSRKKFISYELKNSLLNDLNLLLLERAFECIENKENTIHIKDSDFDKIVDNKKIDRTKLLESLDIIVQILAKNTEAIDEENYTFLLSGCIASNGALNTLGRFSDLFSDNEGFSEVLSAEKKLLGDEYVIAELFGQFNSGRVANVDLNSNAADYQICLGGNVCAGKKEIEIDDIYIGVDEKSNQFYAKSHKYEKKVFARTSHMLNNMFGSNSYRFLRDICSLGSKFQIGATIEEIGNINLKYFPRIMYKRIIIQPAKWRISALKLQKENFSDWEMGFLDWTKKHNVPQYVNYSTGDNFLKLDINNSKCRKLLYYASRKEKTILLTETFSSPDELWIQDEWGKKYCSEFVFSFIREKEEMESFPHNIPIIAREKKPFQIEKERLLFPGEKGWYFYKLYGMTDRMNEFLGVDLMELVSSLKQSTIENHFFIRYVDSKEHVRLRIRVKKEKESEFLFSFQEWLKEERKKGLITNVSQSVYEREIERYGGECLIEIAEEFFSADSEFVETLKAAEYRKKIIWSKECIGIWAIKGLLDSWGMDMIQAEAWLSQSIKKNEYREFYKKNRIQFRKSLSIDENNIENSVLKAYQYRNLLAEKYFKKIKLMEKLDHITNTELDILSTLIHMFCNRYMANNVWEREVRALTRHSLHEENSYNTHKQCECK